MPDHSPVQQVEPFPCILSQPAGLQEQDGSIRKPYFCSMSRRSPGQGQLSR